MYSLVRRDHHELANSILGCGTHHVVSTENIVQHRLEEVFFHHGNVLVSSSMKGDGWPVMRKDLRQSGRILNAADFRNEPDFRIAASHLLIEMEQSRFGNLKSHNVSR